MASALDEIGTSTLQALFTAAGTADAPDSNAYVHLITSATKDS